MPDIGWSVVIVFITMRVIKGDWHRVTDPDTWDFMYAQQLLMELCIAITINLFLQAGFASLRLTDVFWKWAGLR
jgi:hypothetical protein